MVVVLLLLAVAVALINKYGLADYLQFALVKPYFGISFIICI